MRSPSTAHRAQWMLLRAQGRVAEHWAAWRERLGAPIVELDRVGRRLELLVAAMYGRPIAIQAAEAVPDAGWFRRFVLRTPGRWVASDALPETDGERIVLPGALDATDGEARAIARYRLLALEQAERVVRGTAAAYPADAGPLVRDLYLLSESVAIDRTIARTLGGNRSALDAERAAALARRPALALLTAAEREVEGLVRQALAADPAMLRPASDPVVPSAESPAASLAWARAVADRIGVRRRYRRVPPVAHWGSVRVAPGPALVADKDLRVVDSAKRALRPPTLPIRGGSSQEGSVGGRDAAPALTAQSTGGSDGQVVHEAAAPRWTRASGDSDASAAGDGNAPRSEAVIDHVPDASADDHVPRAADPRDARVEAASASLPGLSYPEWDHVTGRYRARAVTVRVGPADAGDSTWARTALREHAALVRGVRQQFEQLRARRLRSGGQRDGDELDLNACVRALVDRRMGETPNDRLYVATRGARHPLAFVLLVDVSGSTKAVVTDTLRMIDLEKAALLLASEALSALGDPYAILTFAGHGAEHVRVATVKAFNDANGESVRRRIGALSPAGFTRLGAAVRHATAVLVREPARHRLLLMLSDGRPNDVGQYMTEYGVEDSRQAIHEARAQGVYPFCLNVDRDQPDYLARIFGAAGYTTLRRAEQLPVALVKVVRQILR
jgi:nitric oxide reductase NorD protein